MQATNKKKWYSLAFVSSDIIPPSKELLEKSFKNQVRIYNLLMLIDVLLLAGYGYTKDWVILLDVILVSIFVVSYHIAAKVTLVRLDLWKAINEDE